MKRASKIRDDDLTVRESNDLLCVRVVSAPEIFKTADEPFLTIAQTCRTFRCGKTKAFDLIRTRQLERVKMGSRTLVTKASVDALIAKLMQAGGR